MRRKALKPEKRWNPALFGIRNPLCWNPESSTRNPESTSWNPESKTAPDSLTWGDPYFIFSLLCVALTSLKYPLNGALMERREGGGLKGAYRWPHVYQLLLLSRVIDVEYGCFTIFYLLLSPGDEVVKHASPGIFNTLYFLTHLHLQSSVQGPCMPRHL